jgi:hypothetical protein
VRIELRTGKRFVAAGCWPAIAFRLKTLGLARATDHANSPGPPRARACYRTVKYPLPGTYRGAIHVYSKLLDCAASEPWSSRRSDLLILSIPFDSPPRPQRPGRDSERLFEPWYQCSIRQRIRSISSQIEPVPKYVIDITCLTLGT